MIKKIIVSVVFLLFSRLNALNITDLVQSLNLDNPNRQVHFDLTNKGKKPISLSVEVRKAKIAKDGSIIEGEEDEGDWATIPESLTIQPNSASVVIAQYSGETPKKEVIYMIGFRQIQLNNPNEAKNKKTNLGVKFEHLTYALVYVRTGRMKPNVSVKYIGDGKISATNTGDLSINIGDVNEKIVANGEKKRLREWIKNTDVAVHPGSTRIFEIDRFQKGKK